MELDDLIEIITFGQSGLTWAENFRRKRVRLLTSDESPIHLADGCALFVHIVPYDHRRPINFRDSKQLNVIRHHCDQIELNRYVYNSDGYLRYATLGKGEISKYFLYLRLGLIEQCVVYEANGLNMIPGQFMDHFLLYSIPDNLETLIELEQDYPMGVFVTLVGAKGWIIAGARGAVPIDRDKIWIEPTCLERKPEEYQESLIPLLDAIWNSTGEAKSPNV